MNCTKTLNTQNDPVLSRLVDVLAQAIDPDQLILFGSRAEGSANTDSDYDILILKQELKDERDHAQAGLRRARAQHFARNLSKDLALADPSVRMIVGFGSTFELWRPYRLDSDIDLGLCGGNWALLWSLVPESEFSVSLVELELQPETFAEQVRIHGEVLYETQ